MSKSKRKVYKQDIFASIDSKDFFGTMYDGMCKSQQYKDLTIGARQFYVLCRVQSKSSDGRACLYKHQQEYGLPYTERDFVFPASHLKRYGIDRGDAYKYFKQLFDAGFLEKRECNKHMKKVNVYSFSNKWKAEK